MSEVAFQRPDPQPIVQILSRGDQHDAAAGITRGRARYMVVFPDINRCIGVAVCVTASHTAPTTFKARCTDPQTDPARVYEQLYPDSTFDQLFR